MAYYFKITVFLKYFWTNGVLQGARSILTYIKLPNYMLHRMIRSALLFFVISLVMTHSYAQLGKITIDLEKDKPKKFKTKVLKSEKTGQNKFTIPRKIIQNTASHFNYYFNAKNKLNAVIDRARFGTQDNYLKLLPFYSYSLDNTASQKSELDSIIYKATAGV